MELWDVLDKHGNKTGKIIERGTKLGQEEYRLILWDRSRESAGR